MQPVNRLIVLDADIKHGGVEMLAKLEAEHGKLPDTPTVRTGGGGRHRYFVGAEDFKSRKICGCDGLELIADTKGVIIPPSIHPKPLDKAKPAYEWIIAPWDMPIAQIPDWLLALANSVQVKGDTPNPSPKPSNGEFELRWSGGGFSDLGALPDGGKNKPVSDAIVFEKLNGVSEDECLAKAWAWCEQYKYLDYKDEIARKVKSIYANERFEASELVSSLASPNEAVESEECCNEDALTLHADAFYGLAGEVVRTILPHSEADEVSLLLNFLVCFGNCVGHKPYFQVSGDYHYANLFALAIAGTSGGKGLAYGQIKYLFKHADATWADGCIINGVGTGEGLIERVRDADDNNAGVADKRRLVLESEFSKLLKLKRRENATLSETLCAAWDDTPLCVENRKANRLVATNTHISILGHITPKVLASIYLGRDTADLFNGFANRFLYALVKRSKAVRRPPKIEDVASHLVQPVSDAIAKAKGIGEMVEGEDAMPLWDEVYLELLDTGIKATERARAQVRRLSMLYALLDGSPVLRLPHLKASLAVWRYCEASARQIFGSDNEDEGDGGGLAVKVLGFIENEPGINRKTLHARLGGHVEKSALNGALDYLRRRGRAHPERCQGEGGGRPAECWFPGADDGGGGGSSDTTHTPSPSQSPSAFASERTNPKGVLDEMPCEQTNKRTNCPTPTPNELVRSLAGSQTENEKGEVELSCPSIVKIQDISPPPNSSLEAVADEALDDDGFRQRLKDIAKNQDEYEEKRRALLRW